MRTDCAFCGRRTKGGGVTCHRCTARARVTGAKKDKLYAGRFRGMATPAHIEERIQRYAALVAAGWRIFEPGRIPPSAFDFDGFESDE